MSPTTMQAARVNGQWVNAKMFRDVKLENVEDEEVFVVTFFEKDLTQWTTFDEVFEPDGKQKRPDSSRVRQPLAFQTAGPVSAVRAYGQTVAIDKESLPT